MTDLRKPVRPSEAAPDEQGEKFVAGCMVVLVALSFLPLRAWLFMIGIGAAHGAVSPIPTISYGTSFLVLLGLDAVYRRTVEG